MSKAFLIIDLQENYLQSRNVVHRMEAFLPEVRKKMKLVWVFMGAAQADNYPVQASDLNYHAMLRDLRGLQRPLLHPHEEDFIMTKQNCDSFEETELADFLEDHSVKDLFLGGFVDIHCVPDSAIGGLNAGYNTRIVKNLTGGVPETGASPDALRLYHRKGLQSVTSQELLLKLA